MITKKSIPFFVTSKGDGHYSTVVKTAEVSIEFTFDPEKDEDGYAYGFFEIVFDTDQWDTRRIGMMYSDSGIEQCVNDFLARLGFMGRVNWSEAGRQECQAADFDFDQLLIQEFMDYDSWQITTVPNGPTKFVDWNVNIQDMKMNKVKEILVRNNIEITDNLLKEFQILFDNVL